MSGFTDDDIRTLGDGLTGPELAGVWILDRRQDAVDARLARLEATLAEQAAS
jgi:hypothetical protein